MACRLPAQHLEVKVQIMSLLGQVVCSSPLNSTISLTDICHHSHVRSWQLYSWLTQLGAEMTA